MASSVLSFNPLPQHSRNKGIPLSPFLNCHGRVCQTLYLDFSRWTCSKFAHK